MASSKHLLPILLLVACSGAHDHKAVDQGNPSEAVASLREAYEVRKSEYSASAPESGWASETDCDSALYSGLALAAGVSVRMDMAELAPGEWHRRPTFPCWTEQDGDLGSKSTISNDMYLGIFWGLWVSRDLPALQRIADYGERHTWVMGKPAEMVSRVVLKTNQIGLLGRMIYALSGGSDDRSYRGLFEYYAPVQEDYERHIQALGIALQGQVYEALRHESLDATAGLLDLNDQMLARVKELAAGEPSNPLYQAVLGTYTGDFVKSVELLLDPTTPVPTYVRSGDGSADQNYWRAEWLFTAHLVLERYPE